MNKLVDRWYSSRLEREIEIARWGDFGQPVLVFPTAGGDAQEIDRFLLIDALMPLIGAGRIKVYSCDSISGRAMLVKEGDSAHLSWVLRQFVEFVGHEMVPAIRTDCRTDDIEIIVAGSSIGAFNALSIMCHYPDAFRSAVCMSGTFRLERFLGGPGNEHFHWASPMHCLGSFDPAHLDRLRTRFAILASGEGPNEDIGESWHAAHVLGSVGVPNRVDSWGPRAHDWPLWRDMLPTYLEELVD
jgi:esterase/lipase superfamily enzyme